MLHNNNILTEESSRRSLMLLAVITFYSLFYNSQNCQWYYSLCFMWQYYCHAYLCRVVYLPKIYTLSQDKTKSIKTNTHTHTRLMALFLGLPRWAGTRRVKPIWNLLKQETVSGSGISLAICKSAPCSRQITTPASQHSVFYRPDALLVAQPTASKHWRQ